MAELYSLSRNEMGLVLTLMSGLTSLVLQMNSLSREFQIKTPPISALRLYGYFNISTQKTALKDQCFLLLHLISLNCNIIHAGNSFLCSVGSRVARWCFGRT